MPAPGLPTFTGSALHQANWEEWEGGYNHFGVTPGAGGQAESQRGHTLSTRGGPESPRNGSTEEV